LKFNVIRLPSSHGRQMEKEEKYHRLLENNKSHIYSLWCTSQSNWRTKGCILKKNLFLCQFAMNVLEQERKTAHQRCTWVMIRCVGVSQLALCAGEPDSGSEGDWGVYSYCLALRIRVCRCLCSENDAWRAYVGQAGDLARYPNAASALIYQPRFSFPGPVRWAIETTIEFNHCVSARPSPYRGFVELRKKNWVLKEFVNQMYDE
jgi:hypothetical protein